MSYARFGLMIATSTAVMFGLMYLNTYSLDHVFYSQTRMWMALLMGATMATIMLGYMWSMYRNKRANGAILIGSAVVFVGTLWLVRSQQTVYDVSYMKAMIPLRCVAIVSNVAFLTYGYFAGLHPVFLLHVVLLPLNILRLCQLRGLIERAAILRRRAAVHHGGQLREGAFEEFDVLVVLVVVNAIIPITRVTRHALKRRA